MKQSKSGRVEDGMSNYPKKLIGKTINAIYLAEDDEAIRFDIDFDGANEPVVAKCDADCCSHTWIENVEYPEAAVGSPVIEIGDIDMPNLGQPDRYGEIQYYGLRIVTAKGECTLDYRNESNGYYGGGLSWPDEYHYGGVYGQNISNETWRKIA